MLEFLSKNAVPLERHSKYSYKIKDTAHARLTLFRLLRVLNQRISIIRANIGNHEESNYKHQNQPYTAKVLKINNHGRPLIQPVKNRPFRLRYDPGHPDAVKSGPKKGYIRFPNIDLQEEFDKYARTIRLFNLTAGILSRFDRSVVLTKKDMAGVENMRFSILNRKLSRLTLILSIKRNNNLKMEPQTPEVKELIKKIKQSYIRNK